MSRADYLSKYTKDPKQKRKRESNVVVKQRDSDIPQVVDEEEIEENVPVKVQITSDKGFKGFKRIDGKEFERKAIEEPVNQPAIFRDLSGRKIDLEERRKQLEQEKKDVQERIRKKEREEQTMNQSEVTRLQKQELDRKLQENKSFSVSITDKEYNKTLKSRQIFDDPSAGFQPIQSQTNETVSGRFFYKGMSPANRFGIRAGYFWDGIDRSNGFESLVLERRVQDNYKKITEKLADSYDEEEI